MNDYYDNYNGQQGGEPPRAPVADYYNRQQPPMAPTASNAPQQQNFQQPYQQQAYQQPYQQPPYRQQAYQQNPAPQGYQQQNPAPQAPPRPPMAPTAPRQQQYYGNYNAQPEHNYYNNGYRQPQKPQGSGAGLKVVLAIVITLLIASIAGFSVFIAYNNGAGKTGEQATEPFFSFEEPTVPATESQMNKDYKESDASDKTDKNYKGLKLNKKPEKVSSDKYGSSYAFKCVEDSAVGIICYTDDQEGTETSYTSMGSGVIISKDGYIVTNSHIVNDSRTEYLVKVITADKKEYKAGVVGFDSRNDLAVLKVDADDLTPATFGDSDEIEVTEDVIVVGNPRSMKYQNSVTKGIVSAVNRRASSTNNARFIQTDAAINPGNSGGALCNMHGQVIGISTLKIAIDTYEGMCFAIPSSTVKKVTDEIIRNSYVTGRVRIGIIGQTVLYGDKQETGIEIGEISKDGPMDGTNAKVGDVITAVDGEKIENFADIYDILEKHKPGDKVEISLYRPGKEKKVKVTVKLVEDKV